MDDYIRREAAKAQIRKAYTRIEDRVAINCVINDVPAADVAPVRHGRWFHSFGGWLCSECNDQAPFWCMASTQNLSNYCPNCGAKMDGVKTMRLIDADKLPKYDGYALSASEVAMAVENAPTVDAVPVVRCRDCIHNYANMVPGGEGCAKCTELPIAPDFFCKNGERKGGDE